MLEINPRSRTKKELINHISQLAKLFNAIDYSILSPSEILNYFLASWTQSFIGENSLQIYIYIYIVRIF